MPFLYYHCVQEKIPIQQLNPGLSSHAHSPWPSGWRLLGFQLPARFPLGVSPSLGECTATRKMAPSQHIIHITKAGGRPQTDMNSACSWGTQSSWVPIGPCLFLLSLQLFFLTTIQCPMEISGPTSDSASRVWLHTPLAPTTISYLSCPSLIQP